MNCKNCNSPLDPRASFCGVCGTSVPGNTTVSGANYAMPAASPWPQPIERTTSFPPQQPMPPIVNPQSLSQQPYSAQDQYSAPTVSVTANRQPQQKKRRRRLGPGGCFLVLTIILVLLFGTLAGVWFFALQPYIHNMVINKLDTVTGQAVDQVPSLNQLPLPIPTPLPIPIPIPPQAKQLPPITITEDRLADVMKKNLSPSDPVKDPVFHITEQGVRVEFNVQPDFLPFSIPCAVSFVPVVNDQGQVVVQNVQIEGAANLIVSPADIEGILNKHLADAVQKLNNPISSIQLQQGAMIIRLK